MDKLMEKTGFFNKKVSLYGRDFETKQFETEQIRSWEQSLIISLKGEKMKDVNTTKLIELIDKHGIKVNSVNSFIITVEPWRIMVNVFDTTWYVSMTTNEMSSYVDIAKITDKADLEALNKAVSPFFDVEVRDLREKFLEL